MRMHTRSWAAGIAIALGLLAALASERVSSAGAIHFEWATDSYGDPLPAGATARLGTTRLRHGETVNLVAFLPDGKTLLTVEGDAVVRQWDAATGKELKQFRTRAEGANDGRGWGGGLGMVGGAWVVFSGGNQGGLALSADSKTLAIRSWDGSIRVWDTAAGKELRHFTNAQTEGGISDIAITPDGKIVAARSYDNQIRLLEVASGKKLRQLGKKPDNNNGGFWGGNGGLAFTPDGKTLVALVGENAGGMALWSLVIYDTTTGNERQRIMNGDPNNMPMAPTFTPDGKMLLWAKGDGSIQVAEAATGKLLRQISAQAHWGCQFVVTPDNKTLLVRSQNAGLNVLDFASGKEIRKFDRPVSPQQQMFWGYGTGSIAVSADGKLAALGGEDHALRLYDLAAGKERDFGGGHRSTITRVSFGPDGKTVFTRGQDGTVRAWDAATGKEQKQLKGPQGAYHIVVSPDGKRLVAGATDNNSACLWDAAANKELHKLVGAKEGLGSLAFSSDGKTVAVYGAADKVASIWLYDAATGKQQRRIKVPVPAPDNGMMAVSTTGVAGVTLSPDGRLVAATITHHTLGLWETATGRELPAIQAPDQKAIQSAVFSPDSRCIVLELTGEDAVRLWEIATGKERRQYGQKTVAGGNNFNNNMVWFGGGFNGGGGVPMPYTRPAPNAAFSPDGRLLAHGRANHVVSVWDLATGKEVAQFKGHQGTVESLMFAPDGKSLVTGGRDTTGLIWNIADLARTSRPQAANVDVAARWKELAGDDAAKAFEAIQALAAAPASAVGFLKEHLHPAAPANPEEIERLIAELDSEQFAVRKRASAQLEKIGDPAAPLLRQALQGEPSQEVRRRIEELLAKTNSITPRGEALRVLRAIEALEAMGTPEARKVLQRLAGGAPEATLTHAAKTALDRLGG